MSPTDKLVPGTLIVPNWPALCDHKGTKRIITESCECGLDLCTTHILAEEA